MVEPNVRKDARKPLKCDLSKYLFTSGVRRPIRCLGTEASREGLGIIGFEELSPNSEVVLAIKGKELLLEVVWSKADTIRQGLFHVGLKTKSTAQNLVELFEEEGLFAAEESKPLPQAEASQSSQEEPFQLDFTTLKGLVGSMHFADQQALQLAGLGQLSATHSAYPIIHEKASLLFVIPHTLKTSGVGTLDETEASKQIIVLQRLNKKWRKIWPG